MFLLIMTLCAVLNTIYGLINPSYYSIHHKDFINVYIHTINIGVRLLLSRLHTIRTYNIITYVFCYSNSICTMTVTEGARMFMTMCMQYAPGAAEHQLPALVQQKIQGCSVCSSYNALVISLYDLFLFCDVCGRLFLAEIEISHMRHKHK